MAKKKVEAEDFLRQRMEFLGATMFKMSEADYRIDLETASEFDEYFRRIGGVEKMLRDRLAALGSICRLIMAYEGHPNEAAEPPKNAAKAHMAWSLLEFVTATENRMSEAKFPEAIWNALEAGLRAGRMGLKLTNLEDLAEIGRRVSDAGGSKPKADKAEVRRLWAHYKDAHPNLSESQCDKAIGKLHGISEITVWRYRKAK
jgi:hypothetical protein